MDENDDLETAPPTPRPVPRTQTRLGLGSGSPPAGERPSQVGTEFEVKQGDGRIDTTGLELEDILDSVPPPRPDDDEELEVSLPTAWTHSQMPRDAESDRPPAPPSAPSAAPEGIGEELDLSGGPRDSEPVPTPPPPPNAEDAEQRRRLDMGVAATSLVGVLDRAEKVSEAFTPPKERQIDISGTRRVAVDVAAEAASRTPVAAASAPSPEEFDFASSPRRVGSFDRLDVADDAGAEVDLTAPVPRPPAAPHVIPPRPRPVSETPDFDLDTSGLPRPEPVFGGPRPATKPMVTPATGHPTALDLDAAAADAGAVPIARVDLRESVRPVVHGADTAIGMHARAESAPPDAGPGLELESPLQAAIRVPSEPTVQQRPVHDSIVPELEVRATSSAPPRISSQPPATDIQPGTGIRELQLEGADESAPALDLAEPPRHSRAPAAATRKRSLPAPASFEPDLDGLEDDRFGETVDLAATPQTREDLAADGKVAPSCRTPDAADLNVPLDQIERVAGYGDAPRNPVLAPLYAFKVYQRRRALKADLARAQRALQEAELDRDTQLAEIFVLHRDKLQSQEHLGEMIDAVHGTEADHEYLQREFAEVSAEYQQRQRELKIRREHADQVVKAHQQAEAARREVYQKCEDDYNRVAVRFKRLQIELRNAQQHERQEPDRAAPLDVQEKRAKQLAVKKQKVAVELNKLLPQAKRLRSIMEAAAKELEAAQKANRRAAGQLKVIEAERKALDSWYAKQTASYGKNVNEADAAYLTAKADVVRAALAVGVASLDARTLDRLREQDRHIKDLAFSAQRLLLALDAYDPDVYKQGFVTGLSLAAAFVLMVVVYLLFK